MTPAASPSSTAACPGGGRLRPVVLDGAPPLFQRGHARLAIAGSRTIAHLAEEVGVADAGFVRCGYLLTVPDGLVEACRGNVEMLRSLGLDTRFLGAG